MVVGVIDWGDVPAWLALAGGMTALFSYLAGRGDVRRSAAAGVFVVSTDWRLDGTPSHGHVRIKLVNRSDLPIKDANVSVWEFGKPRWTWRLRRLPDWMTSERLEGRLYATVEPQSEIADDVDYAAPKLPSKRPESIVPPILLTFRDGNGRQWVRWPNGRLNRIWVMRF